MSGDTRQRDPGQTGDPGDPGGPGGPGDAGSRGNTGDSRPSRRRRPSGRERGRGGDSGGRRLARVLGRTLAVLVVVAAVGAAGWWFLLRESGTDRTLPDEIAGVDPNAGSLAGDRAIVLVFPEWDATGYVSEQRQIPSRSRADEDLLTLMENLCAGPNVSGAVNAVPRGTAALAAFYDPVEHSVVLDFSVELVTRHPGGSAAEAATVASIMRTVALNFPDARSCLILVDGAQVETLKGHVTLDQPLDPRRWL